MSERHAITTEDLANQHRTSEEQARQEIPEQHEPGFDRSPEDERVTDEGFADERPVDERPVDDQLEEERFEPATDESIAEESTTDEPGFDEPVADEPVTDESVAATAKTEEPQRTALFADDEIDRFREEWRSLQSDFVDDPRAAVRQADELVAQVMQTLATTFADRKSNLEGQWSRGEDVQTEDLRLALQQYRKFFQQLLAV